LHSYWSHDSTIAPEAYFRHADQLGLKCIAITDHDVFDVGPELDELSAKYPHIRAPRSVEMLVRTSVGMVDLLCYGLPDPIPADLAPILAEQHERVAAQSSRLAAGLTAMGYDPTEFVVRPDNVVAVQGQSLRNAGKSGAAMVAKGLFATVEEYTAVMDEAAMRGRELLGKVSLPRPRAEAFIPVIKATGALLVLAHPHGSLVRDRELRPEHLRGNEIAMLDILRAELQLDGLECCNGPGVPQERIDRHRAYCVKHGLLSTAGRDCHGGKPDMSDEQVIEQNLGWHLGANEWLDEFLTRLPCREPEAAAV
jgi:predicted metal-dependent phosphoesterase TrpH